jgi:hypothetical protein
MTDKDSMVDFHKRYTVKASQILGPIFPWEFPAEFDLFFHRYADGYWQAWGFRRGVDEEIVAVDVLVDRSMWE